MYTTHIPAERERENEIERERENENVGGKSAVHAMELGRVLPDSITCPPYRPTCSSWMLKLRGLVAAVAVQIVGHVSCPYQFLRNCFGPSGTNDQHPSRTLLRGHLWFWVRYESLFRSGTNVLCCFGAPSLFTLWYFTFLT